MDTESRAGPQLWSWLCVHLNGFHVSPQTMITVVWVNSSLIPDLLVASDPHSQPNLFPHFTQLSQLGLAIFGDCESAKLYESRSQGKTIVVMCDHQMETRISAVITETSSHHFLCAQ